MKLRVDEKHLPVLATLLVCVLLYAATAIAYPYFLTLQVFWDLLADNAVLGIISVGMTFVIVAGGIDLSVASVVALSTMVIYGLTGSAHLHLHPLLAMLLVLPLGALLGWGTGAVIHYFDLPPFLVTLATLFLARGACFLVSMESKPLSGPFFDAFAYWGLHLGGVTLRAPGFILLAVVLAGVLVAQFTKFGRNVYALGGNEYASKLMGLPVGRTKVLVYMLSGLCAALAGVVAVAVQPSANPGSYMGWELNAIAAVVIGGTLLTGGVGYIAGTLVGVLILGIIQDLIYFNGRLDASWAQIAGGLLLFLFIALQKILTRLRLSRTSTRGFAVATGPA